MRPVSTVIAYPEKYESKTLRDEGKLITKYEPARTTLSNGVVYASAANIWKLSEDGKKLTLTSSSLSENNSSTGGGELFGSNYQTREIKYVFERIN